MIMLTASYSATLCSLVDPVTVFCIGWAGGGIACGLFIWIAMRDW